MCIACLLLGETGECADSAYSHTIHHRHKKMGAYFEDEDYTNGPDRKYMTGGWAGARKKLADRGITFASSYVVDTLGNPVGGKAHGLAYAGSLGADVNLNFEKLCGVKGFDFYLGVVFRTGTSLSGKKIDNQFPVQQNYGGQNFRFDQIFFRKKWLDGKIVGEIGRLNAGDNFLQSPLYYKYVSNAFDGNPIGVFFNNAFTAYPNATWGALLLFNYPNFEAKIGVYNGNKEVSQNRWHGLNFQFKSTDGAQLTGEVGYVKTGDYPGHYRIGGMYFTKDKAHFVGNGRGPGNYTLYLLIDQVIAKGVTPFAALLFSPKDRNKFPFFISSGITFDGIIPSRKDDFLALGVAYGRYSRKLNVSQALQGEIEQNFETVIELNYKIQVTRWFEFQPDLQYIINPKGLGLYPNALAVGFQSKLVF